MAVVLPFGRSAARLLFGIPHDVIRDEKIEPAVVVVIEPSGRNRPPGSELRIHARKAGTRGHIGETAVAEISVESVALHAGDENIGESVVVEVAGGHRYRISFACESRLRRDVGERHVAVVSKQPVEEFRARFAERGNGRAVGEEDVRAAIVVVVEHGNAAER